jgi:hypothetical protein
MTSGVPVVQPMRPTAQPTAAQGYAQPHGFGGLVYMLARQRAAQGLPTPLADRMHWNLGLGGSAPGATPDWVANALAIGRNAFGGQMGGVQTSPDAGSPVPVGGMGAGMMGLGALLQRLRGA